MNISIRPDLARFVEDKVQAGQFADAEEVVNGALDMLKDQEALSTQDVDELWQLIASGIAQLDRGEGTPWNPEEIRADGRKFLAARKR